MSFLAIAGHAACREDRKWKPVATRDGHAEYPTPESRAEAMEQAWMRVLPGVCARASEGWASNARAGPAGEREPARGLFQRSPCGPTRAGTCESAEPPR